MDAITAWVFYIVDHKDYRFVTNGIQSVSEGVVPHFDKHWTILYKSFWSTFERGRSVVSADKILLCIIFSRQNVSQIFVKLTQPP